MPIKHRSSAISRKLIYFDKIKLKKRGREEEEKFA